MPFPFIPGGAILAATVLVSAIVGFVAAMMAIDKTATRVFGGAVSGMVAGARRWRDGADRVRKASSDELRPITAAALRAASLRAPVPAPVAAGRGLDQEEPTSTWTDEDVPPVEPLDRVRPRMR